MRHVHHAQHAEDQAEPDGDQEHQRGVADAVENGQDGKSRVHGKPSGKARPPGQACPEDGDRGRYCLKVGTSILTNSGFSVFSHSTERTPAGLVITFGSKIIMLSSSLKS